MKRVYAIARQQTGMLVAAALVLGFLVAVPLAGDAAPGPYARAKITCAKSIPSGSTTTVNGSGFPGDASVALAFDGATAIGSGTTSASGTFAISATIPAGTPRGTHSITATVTAPGGSPVVVKSCSFKVTG